MDKNFGGVVWTNHALERMRERGIKQGDAWATFRRSDSSRKAQKEGIYVYYKTYPVKLRNGTSGNQRLEVVAAQNKKKQWIIMSVWSKKVKEKKQTKKTGPINRIVNKLLGK